MHPKPTSLPSFSGAPGAAPPCSPEGLRLRIGRTRGDISVLRIPTAPARGTPGAQGRFSPGCSSRFPGDVRFRLHGAAISVPPLGNIFHRKVVFYSKNGAGRPMPGTFNYPFDFAFFAQKTPRRSPRGQAVEILTAPRGPYPEKRREQSGHTQSRTSGGRSSVRIWIISSAQSGQNTGNSSSGSIPLTTRRERLLRSSIIS